MKKEELMIGDWVWNTHNRQAEQVQEIGSGLVMLDYNDLYEYDEIEPIPLTEEILEASGFRYHSGEQGMFGVTVSPYYECEGSPHIFCDGDPFAVWFENECDIRYVHELQHVLRMCGVEKEIVLPKED